MEILYVIWDAWEHPKWTCVIENKAQKFMEEGHCFWPRATQDAFSISELQKYNSQYDRMGFTNHQHWHHMGALWQSRILDYPRLTDSEPTF